MYLGLFKSKTSELKYPGKTQYDGYKFFKTMTSNLA